MSKPEKFLNIGISILEARGENPEELWRTCGDNARRFFGLPAQE